MTRFLILITLLTALLLPSAALAAPSAQSPQTALVAVDTLFPRAADATDPQWVKYKDLLSGIETLAFAAAEFLGGSAAIRRTVKTEFDVHDVLLHGLPSAALSHLLEQVIELDPEDVLKAVGVSARTVQRRSHRPRSTRRIRFDRPRWAR